MFPSLRITGPERAEWDPISSFCSCSKPGWQELWSKRSSCLLSWQPKDMMLLVKAANRLKKEAVWARLTLESSEAAGGAVPSAGGATEEDLWLPSAKLFSDSKLPGVHWGYWWIVEIQLWGTSEPLNTSLVKEAQPQGSGNLTITLVEVVGVDITKGPQKSFFQDDGREALSFVLPQIQEEHPGCGTGDQIFTTVGFPKGICMFSYKIRIKYIWWELGAPQCWKEPIEVVWASTQDASRVLPFGGFLGKPIWEETPSANTGEAVYLIMPGNTFLPSRRNWKALLRKKTAGITCSACCHHDPASDDWTQWMDTIKQRIH